MHISVIIISRGARYEPLVGLDIFQAQGRAGEGRLDEWKHHGPELRRHGDRLLQKRHQAERYRMV